MKKSNLRLAVMALALAPALVAPPGAADGGSVAAYGHIWIDDLGGGASFMTTYDSTLWTCVDGTKFVWPFVMCYPPHINNLTFDCHAMILRASGLGDTASVKAFSRCNANSQLETSFVTGVGFDQKVADLGHIDGGIVCQAQGYRRNTTLLPPRAPYKVECYEPNADSVRDALHGLGGP